MPQPVQLAEPAETEVSSLPAVPEAVITEEELSEIEEQLASGTTADPVAHLTPPALEPAAEESPEPATESATEFPPSVQSPQNEISQAQEQMVDAPAETEPAAPPAETQPGSAPAQPEENPEQPALENGEEKQPPQGA